MYALMMMMRRWEDKMTSKRAGQSPAYPEVKKMKSLTHDTHDYPSDNLKELL